MAELRSVSELTITGLPPAGLTADFERWLANHPVAGFLLFRSDYEHPDQLAGLVERLRAANGEARTFFCLDEEGGWVTQLTPAEYRLPSARALARGAEPEEVEVLAHHLACALAGQGIDINFAPVYDVETEPQNPIIGPRAFGSEPTQVIRYAEAVSRGLLAGGVLPCAKHFPGHGATTVDSHLALPRLDAAISVLEALHLRPFEVAIESGVPLLMSAHVVYPQLDPSCQPASLSAPILTALLRKRLRYGGAVITDALEMKAVSTLGPPAEIARRALVAGADLLLYGEFTPDVDAAVRGADDARRRGELPTERVDEAVARKADLWAARDRAREAARPASPTPTDLVSLCRRSLTWLGSDGEPPSDRARALSWQVIEPTWRDGESLADLLSAAGWQVESHPWERLAELAVEPGRELLVACPRRDLLTPEEHSWLSRAASKTAVWLVAFAQDGFLHDFPGAAGRLSAGDPSPAMRRAVVEALTAPSRLAARAAR